MDLPLQRAVLPTRDLALRLHDGRAALGLDRGRDRVAQPFRSRAGLRASRGRRRGGRTRPPSRRKGAPRSRPPSRDGKPTMKVVLRAMPGTVSRIPARRRVVALGIAARGASRRGPGARRAGAGCRRTGRSAVRRPSASGPTRAASSGRRRGSGSTGTTSRGGASDERREALAAEADVLAVAGRVLRDQDELGDSLRLERARLADERLDGAGALEAAHLRNGAEGARVVAPLGDLQVGVAAAPRQDARREVVVEARGERLGR